MGRNNMITEVREIVLQRVPYFSQKEEAAMQRYGSKACGLTSLRMALAYYGHQLSMGEMGVLADRVGAYSEQKGWLHSGMVNIARDVGLRGFRINYSFLSEEDETKAQPILAQEGATFEEISRFNNSIDLARREGSIAALTELIKRQIPVITSMTNEFTGLSASHLVVVKGRINDRFIINDPWERGADHAVDVDEFNKMWTQRAVVIYR